MPVVNWPGAKLVVRPKGVRPKVRNQGWFRTIPLVGTDKGTDKLTFVGPGNHVSLRLYRAIAFFQDAKARVLRNR